MTYQRASRAAASAFLCLALFAACSATSGQAQRRPEATSAPTPSPSFDLNDFSVAFADGVQRALDTLDPRTIEIAPRSVERVDPYGDVLLVKIVDSELNETETGFSALAAIGSVAGERRSDLQAIAVQYLGFEDPSGGRVYVSLDNLLALEDGEITVQQAFDRLIFDY